jgi:tRNA threonylcarbamoyladenosine biosynthesis protein TsaE
VNPRIAGSVEEMIALGRESGERARAGDIWLLSGDLGAGKTHWVKGFVQGIESPAEVTSPTFGLMHEYPAGRLPIFHFDFYRLGGVEELLAIGWDETLEQGGVVLAEWGERFPELFPSHARSVRITVEADGSRSVAMAEI